MLTILNKLRRVLETRNDMFVVARTDATDVEERVERAKAFALAGADAILMDAVKDLSLYGRLKKQVDKPFMFNQIAGGKSPRCSLSELRDAGVSLVNYSTPCLFAAQAAIENAMKSLKDSDGLLPAPCKGGVDVKDCNAILNENLARRVITVEC